MAGKPLNRKEMLTKIVQGSGLAILGSIPWAAFISESRNARLVLRPPGALDESQFVKTCIRCGLCVEACPYHTLSLVKAGEQGPLGTPYFTPRDIPCYMCEDIPCVTACPSGALDETLVSVEKEGAVRLDINEAKMGVAVVDSRSCIAYWGIQCDACYRACPLMGTAIFLDKKRNERTGKHAMLIPEVDGDICTGCGLCEHACITKKPSIRVLTRDAVQGEVDTNYIKGWDRQDEMRLLNADEDVINTTDRSSKSPVDYLNSDDLLNDD